MFTFVQTAALPSASTRAACICGARVRAVRAAAPPSVAIRWAPLRACDAAATPPPAEAEDKFVDAVVEDTPIEPGSISTADDTVAEVATTTEMATAAVEVESKDEMDERREKRKRRRRREVTLPLEKMEVGMELEGVVKSVTSYGAFVGDMGTPTDGLLHVSQLAAGFVENVTDVVQVGNKVKVRVTEVNLEKGNFSLSMKPVGGGEQKRSGGSADARRAKWEAFSFDPAVFVDARVTSITDFGGFCQLIDAEGNPSAAVPTDGLVHISELSEGRVNSVAEILSVGQQVKVRVVNVDPKRNRISLSMREPREGGESGDRNVSAGVDASNSKQPVLKTAFELAFERAGIKPQ